MNTQEIKEYIDANIVTNNEGLITAAKLNTAFTEINANALGIDGIQELTSNQKQNLRNKINAQETLVSGTNIKTVNNQTILGSGNIEITGASITVDDQMSSASTNPVQNKVIKEYVDGGLSGKVTSEVVASVTPVPEFPYLRYDVQTLTESQKEQARNNIGVTATGGTGGVVDTEMSDSSTNAVQNKVIKKYVDNSIVDAAQEMDVPKLFWTGSLPVAKSEGNIRGKITYSSKSKSFECYGTLKVQGNSSTIYPKKNFTLTFYSDAEYSAKKKVNLRWGKQSKYVLKANWIDLSHARNVVSCRIWGDSMDSRTGYTSYPEALVTSPNNGVVNGFPIKFYANGIYYGRYSLNIPKDAWMANMDKSSENEVILCGENYIGGCFRALPVIDGSDWTDELHDTVPATILSSWTEAVSFVMNSSDAEFYSNLSNHFDVESLIDYYIYGIISCNLDGYGKNQLYMKYANTPYIVQTYDMDSTWGLWWNGQSFVSTGYTREEYQDYLDCPLTEKGNLLFIRLANLFAEEIATRWVELKNTKFSVDNLIIAFEKWTDICPKELVEEDYAPTTANGNFTNIPSKTTNNIQQIRDYIVKRRVYAEEKLSNVKHYDVYTSKNYGQPGESLDVTISTNLPSTSSTITVSGNATFDSATMKLTINNDAQFGDSIVVNAVSTYDSAYTATTSVDVLNVTLLYSANTEFVGNSGDTLDTNLKVMGSGFTNWTLFVKCKKGADIPALAAIGCENGSSYKSIYLGKRYGSDTFDLSLDGGAKHNMNNEAVYGVRRYNDAYYYSIDGSTWNEVGSNLPPQENNLLVGCKYENGEYKFPFDGNVMCFVYQGQLTNLSDVWHTPYVNNPRYITLNTSTAEVVKGSTYQLTVADTNYRDRRWEWISDNSAVTVDTNGLVTVDSSATTGSVATVICRAINTSEQSTPATASCQVTVVESPGGDGTPIYSMNLCVYKYSANYPLHQAVSSTTTFNGYVNGPNIWSQSAAYRPFPDTHPDDNDLVDIEGNFTGIIGKTASECENASLTTTILAQCRESDSSTTVSCGGVGELCDKRGEQLTAMFDASLFTNNIITSAMTTDHYGSWSYGNGTLYPMIWTCPNGTYKIQLLSGWDQDTTSSDWKMSMGYQVGGGKIFINGTDVTAQLGNIMFNGNSTWSNEILTTVSDGSLAIHIYNPASAQSNRSFQHYWGVRIVPVV